MHQLAGPTGTQVIANDDAAQLLCAIFNAMPWLAVKRLGPLRVREPRVDLQREDHCGPRGARRSGSASASMRAAELFPELYRKSWRLTRIVAVYLVGQILQSDATLKAILDDPKTALDDRAKLDRDLDLPVRVAAATLKQRHDQRDRDDATDAFNVDFKRQDVLHELRNRARDNFTLATTVGSLPTVTAS